MHYSRQQHQRTFEKKWKAFSSHGKCIQSTDRRTQRRQDGCAHIVMRNPFAAILFQIQLELAYTCESELHVEQPRSLVRLSVRLHALIVGKINAPLYQLARGALSSVRGKGTQVGQHQVRSRSDGSLSVLVDQLQEVVHHCCTFFWDLFRGCVRFICAQFISWLEPDLPPRACNSLPSVAGSHLQPSRGGV